MLRFLRWGSVPPVFGAIIAACMGAPAWLVSGLGFLGAVFLLSILVAYFYYLFRAPALLRNERIIVEAHTTAGRARR